MTGLILRYGIIAGLIVATPMLWLMLTVKPGDGNPLGVEHYFLAWPNEYTDAEAVRSVLKGTFLLPNVTPAPLPPRCPAEPPRTSPKSGRPASHAPRESPCRTPG